MQVFLALTPQESEMVRSPSENRILMATLVSPSTDAGKVEGLVSVQRSPAAVGVKNPINKKSSI